MNLSFAARCPIAPDDERSRVEHTSKYEYARFINLVWRARGNGRGVGYSGLKPVGADKWG
jgi:hypothetical protein